MVLGVHHYARRSILQGLLLETKNGSEHIRTTSVKAKFLIQCNVHSSNVAMENGPGMAKMYLLWNMGIFFCYVSLPVWWLFYNGCPKKEQHPRGKPIVPSCAWELILDTWTAYGWISMFGRIGLFSLGSPTRVLPIPSMRLVYLPTFGQFLWFSWR